MLKTTIRLIFFTLLIGACIYLARIDYSEKLETDVSSLLPRAESNESRFLRRLISEEQGRAVYIEMSGLPKNQFEADEMALSFVDGLRANSLVEHVVRLDGGTNVEAFKFVGANRMELLFPKWWASQWHRYQEDPLNQGDEGFSKWAAQSAIDDLNSFLESPAALELARPGLMDPLLLNISTLMRMSDAPIFQQSEPENHANGSNYYWMTLAGSPLDAKVQQEVETMFQGASSALKSEYPSATLEYGGLVKLANASRSRIQSDVFKINILSLLGVIFVSNLLLRRPWKLGQVIPVLLVVFIGALTVTFLIFDRVNVIVLVVGSILIGTAIDYAIHMLYSTAERPALPTQKLVGLACFSTVSGFLLLLFSDMPLIREIGVFVGAGLLSSYLMVRFSIRAQYSSLVDEARFIPGLSGRRSIGVAMLACLLLAFGLFSIWGVKWQDDVRNLEAPAPALVEADITLRAKVMGGESQGHAFLTSAPSYLELMSQEEDFIQNSLQTDATSNRFGISSFLSNSEDIRLLADTEALCSDFFEQLRVELISADYNLNMFEDFFSEADRFVQQVGSGDDAYEQRIKEFSDLLAGPLESLMGESDGYYWSLSSIQMPLNQAIELSSRVEATSLFSQLAFLNQSLDRHRKELAKFGLIAFAVVICGVLFFMGIYKGALVVAYPILAVVVAVALSGVLFGPLNMFHLIGCFLGVAIALDYALFSVESFVLQRPIPFSVWLSAGTTVASFLALGFSSIPVVQGLGSMVATIACITLLFLSASKGFVSKLFKENETS
jgi:predicted exporter